jgi:hypothetical protein
MGSGNGLKGNIVTRHGWGGARPRSRPRDGRGIRPLSKARLGRHATYENGKVVAAELEKPRI